MSAVARHSLHEAARRSQNRFTHNRTCLSLPMKRTPHQHKGCGRTGHAHGARLRVVKAREHALLGGLRSAGASSIARIVAACSRSASHGRTYPPAGADAAPAPAVPHCALPAPAAARRGPLCSPRTAAGADGAAWRGCVTAMALRPLLAPAAEAGWALAAATAAAGKAMGLAGRKPGGDTRGRCSCSARGAGLVACGAPHPTVGS